MEGTIHVSRVDAATVISLAGDHDLTTSDAFHDQALAALAGCHSLIVDLSGLSSIDSKLVGTLIRLRGVARCRGIAFDVILGGNREIRRAVEPLRLTSRLHCHSSLARVPLEASRQAGADRAVLPSSASRTSEQTCGPRWYEVWHPRADAAVVELHGEHDIASKHELRSLLSDLVGKKRLVVVDVSNAEFIDSSVLDNLLKSDAEARLAGNRFVLQVGSALSVHKALEVSGLLDYLPCALTREEALLQDPATL